MSKATKVLLIIATIAVLIGIFLSLTGFFMGAKYRVNMTENGLKIFKNSKKISDSFDLQTFHNMALDINFSNLEFIESDKYYIEYTYYEDEGKPEISVENDLLKIKCPEKQQNFNIGFGINFENEINNMKIYYPAGTEFVNTDIINKFGEIDINKFFTNVFKVDLSFGDMDLNDIQSKTIDVKLEYGAGKFKNGKADSVTYTQGFGDGSLDGIVSDNVTIKMEYGNLDINDITAEKADIENNFGMIKGYDMITKGLKITTEYSNTDISGEFYGNTDIKASFGNVDIESDLNDKQYNCLFNADFGNISLNNKIYNDNITIDNKAENNLTADVNNGNITVKLK